MKRTRTMTAIGAGILAALLIASAAFAATSGTVTITARVRAYAPITQTDARHVLVKANTPWTLEILTRTGEKVRVDGFKTSGTAVELPENAAAYSLIWD